LVSASACFASASWLDWISNMATAATLNKARITIGEACKWPIGLSRRPSKAAGFYATLTAAAMLGVAITLSPIDPIKVLYWTAVINGVVAVPVMTVMMLMAAQPRIMGKVHDFRLAAGARLGVDRGDGRMRRRNGGRLVREARRRGRSALRTATDAEACKHGTP
jgi:Mn2+/Fe2+ NRAMP family transporter